MKKFLLTYISFLLLCFAVEKSSAQALRWEWSKSYGNSGIERAEKIAVDSRNGVYSYGIFTSNILNIGSNTFTNNGGSDLFLVKHDTLGNVQWAKTFGGIGVDTTGSICTDRMGNIIITGSFSNTISIGSYTFTSAGQKNIFIAKLNNAGNIIWAQQLGCSGDAIATDIKTDIANSIYTTGNYKNGDLLFGNIMLPASNTNNLFYSKLGDDGSVIWAKKMSSNAVQLKISNIEFPDPSKVILIGYGSSAGGAGSIHFEPSSTMVPPIFLSSSSLFYAKFDTSGTFITQKQGAGVGAIAQYFNSTIGNSNDIINTGAWLLLSNPNPGGLFYICDSNFVSRTSFRAGSLNGASTTTDVVYNKQKRSFFIGNSYGTTNFSNGFMINEPQKNALFIAETDTLLITKNLLYAAVPNQASGTGNFLSCDIDTLTNSLYVAGSIATTTPPFQIGSDILVGNGSTDILITKVNINGYGPAYSMNDTTICAGMPVGLGLAAPPSFGQGPYTYSWTPSTGLSSTNTIVTSAAPPASTLYTLEVTDALSVTQTQTVMVNVIPPPPALTISAGGPLTFCQGGSVTLTASAGQNYIWSNGATTQSITVNASGTYFVKDSAGTCTSPSSNSMNVQVNPLPARPTVTASGPLTFCTGGTVTLTSGFGQNYIWNTGATTQSITVNNSGTYSVKVVADGCESLPSNNMIVQVNPVPPAPTITTGGPITFCDGGSVTLTSGAGQNYIWSNGATTQSITVNNSGVYSVKIVTDGCESLPSDNIIVEVKPVPPAPTIAAGGSLTFCNGGSVILTSGAGQNYIWSNGATTQSITVNNSGVYSVKIIADGCESLPSDNTTVQVKPVPAAPAINAAGPIIFCDGGSVTLSSSGGQNYIWSNGATTQSITVNTSGTYSVKIAADGCESSPSATTMVAVNANPPVPVITQTGNLLTSSAATGNQWYLDGIMINGATNSTYYYSTPGVYSVQVTNAASCVAVSDNLIASRTNGIISILNNGDEFLHLVSPNPVRFSSSLEYNIRSSSKVSITLHNSDGKKAITLLNEQIQAPGYYKIPLSSKIWKLNNGIYYILYRINGELITDSFVIGR